MRRSVLFIVIVLLTAGSALAEEAVLIDFSQLTLDYPADFPVHNERTLVDYSVAAGSSYTEEEKAEMKISLAVDAWEIDLASSSRRVNTVANSMIRPARVREGASNYENETILGARIQFPIDPFNSWALIRPPFEIPAYADLSEVQDDGSIEVAQEEVGRGRKFDNIGVVKNVGVLRSVSMNVLGLNFPSRYRRHTSGRKQCGTRDLHGLPPVRRMAHARVAEPQLYSRGAESGASRLPAVSQTHPDA